MKRYITSKPDVTGGVPCIVGTRIPSLPITNSRFDVKHIKGDYKQNALSDSQIYEFAIEKRFKVFY